MDYESGLTPQCLYAIPAYSRDGADHTVAQGKGEAEKIIAYYNKYILPKLHPHQQALLVPGIFACSTGIGVTQNRSSQTAMVMEKLEALQEYALGQPKIGGFYP